uniref:Uncharacterized protein n=1 Tax=Anopheles minimus TaxID=112268 RepID=A0A182WQ87_9DIPT
MRIEVTHRCTPNFAHTLHSIEDTVKKSAKCFIERRNR